MSSWGASLISAPVSSETLLHGYTVEGNEARVETTFCPEAGITAHATEPKSSVALEPQHTSATSQDRSEAAALLRGSMPFFSASASNSAAPPLASESAHSEAILWAAGEVVATFA